MVDGPTFQDGSLVLSFIDFVLVTVGLVIARRMNGQAPPVLKIGLAALWLYALLRIYSASSYLWGPEVPGAIWPILRASVLVMLTLITIVLIALIVFYWRRVKKQ